MNINFLNKDLLKEINTANNKLKIIWGNLKEEKTIYLEIKRIFVKEKLLINIIKIFEKSKSLERFTSNPFILNETNRINIINKGIDNKINLNFTLSLRKIIIIKEIIKLKIIPSFLVQIIKFKQSRIQSKLSLLFWFLINKL